MKIYDLIDEYIEILSNWKELYDLYFRIDDYDLNYNPAYDFLKLKEFENLYQRIYLEIINSLPIHEEKKELYLNSIQNYIDYNLKETFVKDLQKENFEYFYTLYIDTYIKVYGNDYESIEDYISDFNVFWKVCSTSILGFISSKTTNLKNITNNIFEINNSETSIISTEKIKLNWNGTNVQLYDVFRQLKNMTGKTNLPLIANSYTDIAQFVKENFEGFSNTKLRTIIDELERNERPKKNPIDIQL